ncbi:hypothetical protein STEG23_007270 [Scotinomys teguina]
MSPETAWASTPHRNDSSTASWHSRKSSLRSSLAPVDGCEDGFHKLSLRSGFEALPPFPEPPELRLRPASLRTQDISHLLARVFQNLYTAQVIGEDLSDSLIKARGSEDARHEEFVDQLQQVRAIYKQRLDEVTKLEEHIIQARARDLAETEHATEQARLDVLETPVKLPPVKTVFRWCIDNELLQKHLLICVEDYYNDPVPFCSAPKGTSTPGCLKLTLNCERRFMLKAKLDRTAKESCKKPVRFDESEYTTDSWTSTCRARQRTQVTVEKASTPNNRKWMKHLRVPQRDLERLLLARMESRNHFLKNPRFFPPNTPHGGKSLIVSSRRPARRGGSLTAEPEWSCADTPVFLAKPSVGFFTDYEIGPVYEMVIALQNTTATSRYLRVLPPSSPYFALGLGMFPGKGGMVAPGMACQYVVQFIPDCLGDFDDFILVETQSAHTLVIPLQARRPPPVLTLSPVLDCGYCLIGGVKVTRFACKNVGFSAGRFCIMPQKSWPPPSFRWAGVSSPCHIALDSPSSSHCPAFLAIDKSEPFIYRLTHTQFPKLLPSSMAHIHTVLTQVLFLPTSLGKAEETFIIVCDNCQTKELVIVGGDVAPAAVYDRSIGSSVLYLPEPGGGI